MTARRANISASLAERGRPELWANEQEASTLSGMSSTQFAAKVGALEDLGFPKRNAWNGKRFIPHIVAFWERLPSDTAMPSECEENDVEGNEHWESDEPRRRTRVSHAA